MKEKKETSHVLDVEHHHVHVLDVKNRKTDHVLVLRGKRVGRPVQLSPWCGDSRQHTPVGLPVGGDHLLGDVRETELGGEKLEKCSLTHFFSSLSQDPKKLGNCNSKIRNSLWQALDKEPQKFTLRSPVTYSLRVRGNPRTYRFTDLASLEKVFKKEGVLFAGGASSSSAGFGSGTMLASHGRGKQRVQRNNNNRRDPPTPELADRLSLQPTTQPIIPD